MLRFKSVKHNFVLRLCLFKKEKCQNVTSCCALLKNVKRHFKLSFEVIVGAFFIDNDIWDIMSFNCDSKGFLSILYHLDGRSDRHKAIREWCLAGKNEIIWQVYNYIKQICICQ